ncbi:MULTISPECIES: hypothetical protein [Streptomyces]|uniref:hypothetical protein n=1 Tax=Streptomyces TaxID=1883 RepID=UPI001F442343|nr:hypothetical protein [Streptomyces lycii]
MTTSADLPLRGAAAPSVSGVITGEPGAPSEPPRADCVADSAGGLTFDVVPPGRPGAAEAWDAALLLRRRGGRGAPADELRLPLVPAGDGRLRAALPSTVALPEGRWDAFAVSAGGEPERIMPGINDLRSLLDRRPDPERGSVAVRIPYVTKNGNLSVRSWLRAPHAEAGEIHVTEESVSVRGRTFGRAAGPDAVVEARRRGDPETVRTAPVTGEGTRFTFSLSYPELAGPWQGGSEAWDLWLRPAADADAVRIGRLLDDVAEKKHIFTYPSQPLTAPNGPVRVGPYYTLDNDLSVRVAEDRSQDAAE